MTLELIISQQQAQITGNPECDNIQNVPWIQANIQFLNTIKGEPGNTPYIGENGNWWIGTTDTGNKAAGEDGKTPTIGENNHWFINGVDTGIVAEGQDGYTPIKGIDYFDGYTPQKGVDYFDGYTPVKDVDYFDGITPTIGLNKHWFIGETDTGIIAEGQDGNTPVIIIGENENWYINGVDSGKPSRGDNGTSAYEIYHAGGGTLSEVDFNESITDIPTHIEDATKHIDTTTAEFSGAIDETNDKFTIWDNSLLKWIRFSFTSLKTYLNGVYHKFGGSSFGAKQIIGSIDNQDFGIITNNTERITVLKDGKVGIGVPNPTVKLEIYNITTGFNSQAEIRGGSSAPGDVASLSFSTSVSSHNWGYVGVLRNDPFSSLIFGVKYAGGAVLEDEKMRITSVGNVGIGAIAPKSKLQVAGGIQCGDDTAAASADKVGTTRYRATANASYVEMCMQVGASSYSWVAIVTNTW